MKVINEKKFIYETPIIEVIEVEVEKGYASSPGDAEGETDDFIKG